MREKDYNPKPSRTDGPDDDLDRVLDSALAIYATVEAREGLEERVLANLLAKKSRRYQTVWAWGFASAILALLIITGAWYSRRQVQPSIADHVDAPRVLKPAVLRDTHADVGRNTNRFRIRTTRHLAVPPLNPKLEQFPSPQPLSEQEKILAMYINLDPEHAALIAEARMETLRQDDAEKMRVASEDARGIGR